MLSCCYADVWPHTLLTKAGSEQDLFGPVYLRDTKLNKILKIKSAPPLEGFANSVKNQKTQTNQVNKILTLCCPLFLSKSKWNFPFSFRAVCDEPHTSQAEKGWEQDSGPSCPACRADCLSLAL